jgi:subfamily B ATP-binding cassette protein MsbA
VRPSSAPSPGKNFTASYSRARSEASRVTLRKYISLSYFLGYRQRWTLYLTILSLAVTMMEAGGLVLLLPIFQFIQSGGDIAGLASKSKMWAVIVNVFGNVSLAVTLPTLMVLSFALILSRQAFAFLKAVAAQKVSETITRMIRVKGVRAYLLANAAFQDQVKLGEVANALTAEAANAGSALMAPARILGVVAMAAIYVVTLTFLSVPLTVASIILAGCLLLVLRQLMRRTGAVGKKRLTTSDAWYGAVVRRMHAARLVRIAGAEAAEVAEINRQAIALERHGVRLTTLRTMGDVVVEPVVAAFALCLLYFATQGYGMSLGEVGVFLVILLRLSPVAKAVAGEAQMLAAQWPSVEAVSSRIRAMEGSGEVDGGNTEFVSLRDRIEFEDVWYRYPSREDFALKGIGFTARRGEMVAVVGPSGAGKSTLIDLLFRLRDPSAGRVMLDGEPITDFSRASLRRHIAYVPQTAQTLADTIAHHVAYGNGEIGRDAIETALTQSGSAEFVAQLPRGMDTPFYETATGFSGGQLQRLELARALARQAPIIVLDEPTSNLDARIESAFRDTIELLRGEGGRTIIVVAHRLSFIAKADRIVVLEQGAVREQGTHDELLAKRGWYAEAWAQQSQGLVDWPPVTANSL